MLIDNKKETINNLKKTRYNKFYKCNVLKDFFKIFRILYKLREDLKDQNKIFIISNTTIFSIYFLFLKLFFYNSKIIIFFHSHIYNKNLLQLTSGFICSLFSFFTSKTIYVSKYTRNWWSLFFPFLKLSKQYVLYNYVELPKKIKRKRHKKLSIGFIGRFEKEKGIHKFLNFAISTKNKKLDFHIFGRGSQKVNKLKKKNIKIYKWSKKEYIYNKINVLFVTSNIENCPLSVLEAKSYGVPTLTTANGGITEIIHNNNDGIVLNKKIKKRNLKNKFLYLLKNIKIFESNCYKNSKFFNIEKNKKNIFKLILNF